MADARLMAARRRAEADPQDREARARYLTERVRSGDLSREALFTAAYMGDRASQLALQEGPPNYGHPNGLGPGGCLPQGCCWRCAAEGSREFTRPYWTIGVAKRWGREVCVRVLVSAAWPCKPMKVGEEACLAAAEAWLVCPCEGHRVQAAALLAEPRDAFRAPAYVAAGGPELAKALGVGLADCVRLTRIPRAFPSEVVTAAITAELVPWALGERDPVRERVEARS